MGEELEMYLLGFLNAEQLADCINMARNNDADWEEYEVWEIIEQMDNKWGGFKAGVLDLVGETEKSIEGE